VLSVPRARLADPGGGREWRSALLSAYQRRSRRAELPIAQVYHAGVNTRPVRRALQGLFAGDLGLRLGARRKLTAIRGDGALTTASALEAEGDAHDQRIAIQPCLGAVLLAVSV
jgi:hypothetical protein